MSQDKDKGRPERHSGDDDVKLDREQRDKGDTRDEREKSVDPDSSPQRGNTGPGPTGTVPGEQRVARPEDYKDPWNPSINTALRDHKPHTDED